jgi:signal transduction histidine kinase
MRLTGVRGRLLLILGLAGLALLAASATALIALLEIREEVSAITDQALPASGAALVLARVGERLLDRTPALMAAKGADARQRQTDLIKADLLLLASETERLRHLHPDGGSDGVEGIARLAPELADNLRDLAGLLEASAAQTTALERQRDGLVALRERVQQILGPSILAVAGVVGRSSGAPEGLFRQAAVAQGPLLEVERLVGSAFAGLLVGAAAPTRERLEQARGTFKRLRDRLESVLPAVPFGLRSELQGAVDELDRQLAPQGVLGLREGELAALERADRLVAGSRLIAAQLKEGVDALVQAANQNIAQAAAAMGDTVLANTILFVGVSVSVVLLATVFSYRFVVRDISLNLRAVTQAMQRLAAGEREARVPATERPDEIGDLARVFSVFKDQAFRVETLHRQLVDKSNLLVATFDSMNDGFTVFDAESRLIAWNPQYLHLYGLSPSDIGLGSPLNSIHRALADKGALAFGPRGEEVTLADLPAVDATRHQRIEIRCPDGRVLELRSNPMPDGGFVTIHMDVSERRAMEGQLRQAQKMEAVGQLTGGIAHDFNNILGAILGNLTFLESAVRADAALHERWKRAMGAADRAARQVERLLAFSRRQRLAPEAVDVNGLILGMLDLVEGSLGQGITLSTDLASDLPPVRVDPGQLENSLINLAINARDAMQGQGRITLATARLDAETVQIAVGDTGCGIPPDLLDRVCEPFFTTKPSGKGSGLGLSMVYGFVRQSGGELRIDSTPGRGTRVRITLPIATREVDAADAIDADTLGPLPRGAGETILVVDDDPDLLAAAADQLGSLGYRAVTARDGAAALDTLEREPDVRLLYTDVVMPPPWDGPALAREALSRRPDLGVLFTSGGHREITEPAAALLPKPVALDRLAQAVRRLLDRQTFSTSASKT